MVAVPDFDDMMQVVKTIQEKSREKIILEVEIKKAESDIVRIATTDSRYFQNGKPPSMAFIDPTYKYAGFEGELVPLRLRLADVSSELEGAKLIFDVMKMQIDLYRTDSANQRHTAL